MRLWCRAALAVVLVPLILLYAPAAQTSDLENSDSGTGPGVLAQQMQSGSLLLKIQSGYSTATRINTGIDIRVSGPIARTTISQQFRNDGTEWTEGIYVFPLPDGAAVDRLRMRAGERLIEGEIREKQQARDAYERAKAGGQRASLVEQERANLFTTNLANLGPGETISIEIGYLETLEYDDGNFSLRVPLTLTPRYIPGAPLPDRQGSGWSPDTDLVADASRITPPVVTRAEDGGHTVTLHVEIDAGVPLEVIRSRYHPVSVSDMDESSGRYQVTLTDSQTPMDHDLELVWRPLADSMPRATLFRERTGGNTHYLLMMIPPDEMSADESIVAEPVPRELVFVVDTSGSMHGTSIQQAKKALLLALDGLSSRDRFNLIQFNSVTQALFRSSVIASVDNVREAEAYVRALAAEGGTEMRPALEQALGPGNDDGYLRQVIFITDGSVGNEQELYSVIDARLGDSRLFTVGIGSAPNSWFMHKAAEAGRGSYTFISALHEVEEKMSGLFRKLERPQITGILVEWPGEATAYPDIVPDLYAGEPVIQKVRLSGDPRAGDQVVISGTSTLGDWRVELPLAIEGQNAGIGAVWARARIEDMLERERRGGDAEASHAAVVATALEHRLVSRFTSLVAVDRTPVRPQEAALQSEQVPNLLPYGQSHRAIFGFPATATGWRKQTAAGLLLLLAAALLVAGRHWPPVAHVFAKR